MWYLRAFEKHGDRLIRSYPLHDVGLEVIRDPFPGQSDDELVGLSWAVNRENAQAVERLVHESLSLDRLEYFIDFYAKDAAAQDDESHVLARAASVTLGVPVTTVAFMNEIAAAFPDAARVIHGRRQQERGEILPHMEMGDLIDWAGEKYAASQKPEEHGRRAGREIEEFLRMIEDKFEAGDQDIDDLIAVSFLEGLAQTRESLPGIRSLLGPRMLAWYRKACEGDDVYGSSSSSSSDSNSSE